MFNSWLFTRPVTGGSGVWRSDQKLDGRKQPNRN